MGFKIGDNIVYAGSGVCQIDDIKDISFFKEKPETGEAVRCLPAVCGTTVQQSWDEGYLMKFVRSWGSKSGRPSSWRFSRLSIQAILRPRVRMVCMPSSSCSTCPGV